MVELLCLYFLGHIKTIEILWLVHNYFDDKMLIFQANKDLIVNNKFSIPLPYINISYMKFIRLSALCLGVLGLINFSCSNDFEEALNQSGIDEQFNYYELSTVSLEEIQGVTSFFESKTKEGLFYAKGDHDAIFDAENIMEVIDTLQNTNYSFRFTYNNSPSNVYYNLVIGKDSLGRFKTPIVLKFTGEDESLESGNHFGRFTGTLEQFKYTDFFDAGLFSKGTCSEHDEYGDPLPCRQEEISDGSISTSGGGSSSGGGGSGGTSSGCTYNSYFVTCGGSNQYTAHPGGSSCGGDGGGSYWVLDVTCPDGGAGGTNYLKSSKDEDCPECESGPSGGVGVNLSLIPTFIEDRISSSQLDNCSKNILNQLKSLNQNDIAKILQRFGAPQTTYDWELITTTPSIPGNAAETDRRNGNTSFDYVTKIDPAYKNQATKISIARTILHEMLHAYMLSHIDDMNAGVTIDYRDFAALWNYLKNTSASESSQLAQHEYMALKFIPPLMAALKEWDGAKQTDQYYEDLAWGALFNTSTFNYLHPNGSSSRSRIINRNKAEDTNSNSNGIAPKGTKC